MTRSVKMYISFVYDHLLNQLLTNVPVVEALVTLVILQRQEGNIISRSTKRIYEPPHDSYVV